MATAGSLVPDNRLLSFLILAMATFLCWMLKEVFRSIAHGSRVLEASTRIRQSSCKDSTRFFQERNEFRCTYGTTCLTQALNKLDPQQTVRSRTHPYMHYNRPAIKPSNRKRLMMWWAFMQPIFHALTPGKKTV